ncbi:PQQ-binding-like beta-propeller repeat protein, partial [bacterium]|nr:PQQ-binding-like beta-propeller repeat protein [bacterium]
TDGTERPRIAALGKPYRDDNDKIQYGAAVDRGIVIAPYVDEILQEQAFRSIPIKVTIPIRKLAGFDVDRWRWKWQHSLQLAGTKFARASFPVAPVCEDGSSFVSAFAIEGFVHCYAASFDSQTGVFNWQTWIMSGQVEQTMFGEHAREPPCAPVCAGDGLVFDTTQMGCVAAMDVDTGRLRWVSEYDQLEVHPAKGYYPDLRNIGWANNAPVLEGGVLITAPMDSDHYYGFEAATGKQLWRRPRASGFDQGAELKYIVGASDGRVVLAGGRRVVCLDVKTGRECWPVVTLERRLLSGRGLIAGGKIIIPASDSVEVLDLGKGTREGSRPVSLTGNLALAGDSLIVASDNQLGSFANERVEKSTSKGKDF